MYRHGDLGVKAHIKQTKTNRQDLLFVHIIGHIWRMYPYGELGGKNTHDRQTERYTDTKTDKQTDNRKYFVYIARHLLSTHGCTTNTQAVRQADRQADRQQKSLIIIIIILN
jgi:hypothetical protein